MVTLVVFDVDGTLVDSQHLIVEGQRRAFTAHGLPVPERKEALSVVGLSLHEAFRRLVGDAGPIDALARTYRAAFQALRVDPAYEEPLFPGMADLIARLRDRDDVRLGIATGKSRRGVDHLVVKHGWDRAFSTIQTADDAPSKPDPTMLLQAMSETGIAPAATVMIGDTTYDMTMAVGAGVAAVGVGWGYHSPGALRAAGAVAVVESAERLGHLLSGPLDAAGSVAGGLAAH